MKHQELNEEELQELDRIAVVFDKEYEKYDTDTKTESIIQIILRSHLYIEHELKKVLDRVLVKPHYLGDRLRFIDVLNIVFAIGGLPDEYYMPLKRINKIRNNFAHNLNYTMTEQDLVSLEDLLDMELKKIYLSSAKDHTTLKDRFRILLFWIWQSLVGENLVPEHIKIKFNTPPEDILKDGQGVK